LSASQDSVAPLEYARPRTRRGKLPRRWPRWVALIVILAAVGSGAVGWWRWQRSHDVVIDCAVPGTEIWIENQKLGVVPLRLSTRQLSALGMSPPPQVNSGPFFTWPNDDGYGEGLFDGTEDERETKIMFCVPASAAPRFLEIETAWGRRTKLGGGQGLAREWRMDLRPVVNSSGMQVSLAPLPVVGRGAKSIGIQATVTNSGTSTASGMRPEIEVFWGTFHTPWRRRSTQVMDLPQQWSSFAPGVSRTTTIQIPVPNVSEDYSVFANFYLFVDSQGSTLAGDGGVYSNSRLLRVR
jgi:hypothetical protein